MILTKDVSADTIVLQVSYKNPINCESGNIFFTKLINSVYDSLKIAKQAPESPVNANDCYYEIPCKEGDIICFVLLLILDTSANFSICEVID